LFLIIIPYLQNIFSSSRGVKLNFFKNSPIKKLRQQGGKEVKERIHPYAVWMQEAS
jgi:hypothetical protein